MSMQWLARRVVLVVPTLLAASIVVFMMIHLAPGDPAVAMLGPMATGDSLASLRKALGLNDPIYVQYGRWLGHAVRGDLGRSIRQQVPVSNLVFQKFWNTVLLGAVGMF